MKHLKSYITEFLLSKETAKDQNELDIDIDDREVKEFLTTYLDPKYIKAFKVRILKTGNIELIGDEMSYKGQNSITHTGLKFVLYIKSKPMCVRRMFKEDSTFSGKVYWSNPPAKQGEYETIEDLMVGFNNWLKKNIIR